MGGQLWCEKLSKDGLKAGKKGRTAHRGREVRCAQLLAHERWSWTRTRGGQLIESLGARAKSTGYSAIRELSPSGNAWMRNQLGRGRPATSLYFGVIIVYLYHYSASLSLTRRANSCTRRRAAISSI